MNRTAKAAALTLIILSCLTPAAAADQFEQGIAQARRGLARHDAAQTLQGLHRAMAGAWQQLPFTAINVNLVAAPPQGYGQFIPRVDNVYRPSEPLILYLEPVGFTVIHDQDKGTYRYHLTADFNLVDAWGRVVSGRRRFGHFQGQSRHFPDRFPLTFTYSLSGLPPGEYKVETILHDVLAPKKTYTIVTPIRIEGD